MKHTGHILILDNTKICIKCGLEKYLNDFHNKSVHKDGKSNICKICVKQYKEKYYTVYKEKISEHIKEYRLKPEIKLKKKEWDKKYRENNKEKCKESQRKYLQKLENRKKRSEYQKTWNKNNPEKINKSSKKWKIKNREKINKFELSKKNNNSEYKLKRIIRSGFIHKLKRNSIKKTNSFFSYTGIKFNDYIEHLKNDPLWNDYLYNTKYFHIDHIIPCSAYNFNNLEDIKKCWNPRNLRFLNASENILKFNKIDFGLINKYKLHDLLPKSITIEAYK
jgi:hypothetical protein